MKKRIFAIILGILICFSLAIPAFAKEYLSVWDNADLLDISEESELMDTLGELDEKHGFNVIIVTTASTRGKSPMEYADDFYDQNSYSDDGVLLLISMEDRDWWISTCGFGIKAFTDAGIDYIGEQIVPYLSEGDYVTAFHTFAALCDEFITRAETGDPYDYGNMPKGPYEFGMWLVISAVVGIVIALIVTESMKSKLKSVRRKAEANCYVRADSMNITNARDIYLYRTLSRVAIPKDTGGRGGSSTHSSSSGRSHGGGGGRF